MKKTFRLLFVFSLIALLSACGSADYSNQTIVGKISSIDGNVITLELGDVKENEQSVQMPQLNGEMPQFDGEAPHMPQNGTAPGMNGERPTMPGEATAPQMNGELPSFDGEMPELPENGETPSFNGETPQFPSDGQMPQFDGEAPQMPQMNGVLQSQMTYTFVSSGKTLKIDLKSIGITLDDLTLESYVRVGDVIEVNFGSDNSIESIRFYEISD